MVLLVLLVPLVPLVHVPRAGARVTRPSVLGHRLAPVLCPASVAVSCAGIRVCIQSGIRGCLTRCFVCCACWQAAGSHAGLRHV